MRTWLPARTSRYSCRTSTSASVSAPAACLFVDEWLRRAIYFSFPGLQTGHKSPGAEGLFAPGPDGPLCLYEKRALSAAGPAAPGKSVNRRRFPSRTRQQSGGLRTSAHSCAQSDTRLLRPDTLLAKIAGNGREVIRPRFYLRSSQADRRE